MIEILIAYIIPAVVSFITICAYDLRQNGEIRIRDISLNVSLSLIPVYNIAVALMGLIIGLVVGFEKTVRYINKRWLKLNPNKVVFRWNR